MLNDKGSEWNRWDLHLHTQSSYDYNYVGNDSDDLLCNTLRKNNIKAVAITDHFTIDAERIENLRSKAPDIVFFPGVELRTDKGANNLHVILIFSEKSEMKILAADFESMMIRDKAKAKDKPETIYWTFYDIVKFANRHNALISIHAGRKTNGIDKEITNASPVKEAIKEDIAQSIDFFEIGQIRDIDDYEKYVFKCVERRPLIICSDCHSPQKYEPKEFLWIKGELTFEGLKQCLYQPQERVFIGIIPPTLDRLNKNKHSNISQIEVRRIDNPSNNTINWFDFKLQLNHCLTAIIGNKGSGKSAFADIIGHICKSHNMHKASFLTNERFRKLPKNFAKDYVATLTWADSHTNSDNLGNINYETTIEDAQYLPQQYIESVCNDIGDIFQQEIDKVIFSYINPAERGEFSSLKELISSKSTQINLRIQELFSKLHTQNSHIIKLENKKTASYRSHIVDSLKKFQETLSRHEKSKPSEIKKPDSKETDKTYQTELDNINHKIEEKKLELNRASEQYSQINRKIYEINILIENISRFESQFSEIQTLIQKFIVRYNIISTEYHFEITSPKNYFSTLMEESEKEKTRLDNLINDSQNGLLSILQKLENTKSSLIASANNEEKLYQKYLKDLQEWERKKKSIIGNQYTDNTLEYYQHELEYLDKILETEYTQAISNRYELVKKIYASKLEIVAIYQSIYAPVQGEIAKILGTLKDSINFQAEIFTKDQNLSQSILNFIDQRFNGKFGKGHNHSSTLEHIICNTDFKDIESVIKFINEISEAVTEDLDNADKKIPDRQNFYDFIYGLSYININFKMKMGNRSLNELSAGERGIVLLIFYLALSQESMPIIIDQPEDNLDNQSVYSKLVPCICKAKQQRQVIIVTHNPNIAVACDAEQIIYCEMDKNNLRIKYESGAIENPKIKEHVIDVLEGTMPAFDLRRKKYK